MTDLSAHIPRDRLYALAHNETLPNRTNGAVLFADVSGFTPLTRTFAKTLGQKRGAEAMLGVLNPLFETLIEPHFPNDEDGRTCANYQTPEGYRLQEVEIRYAHDRQKRMPKLWRGLATTC